MDGWKLAGETGFRRTSICLDRDRKHMHCLYDIPSSENGLLEVKRCEYEAGNIVSGNPNASGWDGFQWGEFPRGSRHFL